MKSNFGTYIGTSWLSSTYANIDILVPSVCRYILKAKYCLWFNSNLITFDDFTKMGGNFPKNIFRQVWNKVTTKGTARR